MTFHAVTKPIAEPGPKVGGDPVWLGEPSWPVHPGTGEPLDFIGQFCLAGTDLEEQYFLNFPHGYGYAYLSPDRLEGRFSWEAA
ncbi:hypothetical protein JCM4814A_82650 [Streptomyces phaeofaciens JCM 4814]|uniref:Uncharacterized protein n=1 Tax=Streptomyces phaeofaciens TaxID=68254 RepID=A0A918M0U7_9ACTN|nr:hypothetical protein [Streptomyces phaeofaciens]GGT90331.1 hypothetical protein GCM10010226_80650 [Streptomyces phaeofaciens]